MWKCRFCQTEVEKKHPYVEAGGECPSCKKPFALHRYDPKSMVKCEYCNNMVDEGEEACEDCKKVSEDLYETEMTCKLCETRLSGSPNDQEVHRISIIEEVGGWEDWERNNDFHTCCNKCYEEKIKPMFIKKSEEDKEKGIGDYMKHFDKPYPVLKFIDWFENGDGVKYLTELRDLGYSYEARAYLLVHDQVDDFSLVWDLFRFAYRFAFWYEKNQHNTISKDPLKESEVKAYMLMYNFLDQFEEGFKRRYNQDLFQYIREVANLYKSKKIKIPIQPKGKPDHYHTFPQCFFCEDLENKHYPNYQRKCLKHDFMMTEFDTENFACLDHTPKKDPQEKKDDKNQV